MTATIQLTLAEPKYQGDGYGYLMEVHAVAVNMTPKVFIYHRGPVDLETGEFQDIYEAVASPAQLDEIPPDKPYTPEGSATQIPYFRTDTLQFVTRTREELAYLWQLVQDDVQQLVNDVNSFEELDIVETVPIVPTTI
jgi:hypothetical protein